MKRSLQYVVGAGALGALLLVDAVPVQAQMIEEILVTARKRTESAQDVPVVIQAFDAAAINRYAASNLEEISELASQVVINPGSSGNGGSVIIRGVGAPTLDPGIENSVTINIDGVQIDRGHVVRQAFFDMGSVQVLEGAAGPVLWQEQSGRGHCSGGRPAELYGERDPVPARL